MLHASTTILCTCVHTDQSKSHESLTALRDALYVHYILSNTAVRVKTHPTVHPLRIIHLKREGISFLWTHLCIILYSWYVHNLLKKIPPTRKSPSGRSIAVCPSTRYRCRSKDNGIKTSASIYVRASTRSIYIVGESILKK